jgi:hypothetical protein
MQGYRESGAIISEHLSDSIVYELRKIPLHSSNTFDMRHKFGKKVYRILDQENMNRVQTHLVLKVLSEVYGLLSKDDGMRESGGFAVLLNSTTIDRSEFISLLDRIATHHNQDAHIKKLNTAKNCIIQFITAASFISLLCAVVYYISADDPQPQILFVIYATAGICATGFMLLLIVPIMIQTVRRIRESRQLNRMIQQVISEEDRF